jgi:5-methyltetrahydrofolate--homocysteine methyltransferase
MGCDLEERLEQKDVLIADGATGTMLMFAGLPPGTAPEVWNVERPEEIRKLHRAYLDAGSEIILTNTFGGTRIKLAKSGNSQRVAEFNQAGARLAQDVADHNACVAGDIGPTGELMAPFGRLTYTEALEAFKEQAAALAEGGVDAIWIETMSDLEEARAAVIAARLATELPVLCSLSFAPTGRTLMGVSARRAAEELWPLGLTAIGANCGEGLEPVDEALRQMREVLHSAPLIAKPNAGRPRVLDGQTVYDMGPADFALRVRGFVERGARIVGACCGSSPAYITAIAEVVGRIRPDGQGSC